MAKLFTIGHSNRTFEEFLDILQRHEISLLIDVRTIPKSRFVPWSNREKLKNSLQKNKIGYQHMPELGGLRHSHKDSINQGWKNAGFRGFADYMQTPEFFLALKKLNEIIKKQKRVAIMCAEAVPWKCHRSLISDAEVARGVKVFHMMSATQLHEHMLTDFAVVDKSKRPIKITYPK